MNGSLSCTFLVLCAVAALALPLWVEASGCDTVDQILQSVEPVSDHYTRRVLQRAQAGISFAQGLSSTFEDDDFLYWLDKSYRSMSQIVDTDLRVIVPNRDLEEATACLHIDLFLIETMMEKVRCEIEDAFAESNGSAIEILRDVLFFLNDRYRALLLGNMDNTNEDQQWWFKQTFDQPDGTSAGEWLSAPYNTTLCCNNVNWTCEPTENYCQGSAFLTEDGCVDNSQCTVREGHEPTDYKMCPFHSDYLSPTVIVQTYEMDFSKDPPSVKPLEKPIAAGYGCDLTVLERYANLSLDGTDIDEAIKAEYQGLKIMTKERDEFIKQSFSMKAHAEQLNKWLGRDPIKGLEFFGWTMEELSTGTEEDPEMAKMRVHTTRIGCSEVDGETLFPLFPPPERWPPAWPEGAVQESRRGPFSLSENVLKLMRSYQDWHIYLAKERPYPDQYKLPGEFEEEGREDRIGGYRFIDTLTRFMRFDYARPFLLEEHIKQETAESFIVAKVSDAPRQIYSKLEPLRSSVKELSKNGDSLQSGIRRFARGLAYYLRRSCLNRPCNERLERILKIVLEDTCFPYTSGDYIDNERMHENCEEGALN